jgi:putative transposase
VHQSIFWKTRIENCAKQIRERRAKDNIEIERFWKSIKYNYIYLNPCDTGLELHEGVQTYIEYYHQKKHQGIGIKSNDTHSKSLNQNAA